MLRISNNTRIRLNTVLIVTISWVILGLITAYYDHFTWLSRRSFEFNDYDLYTTLATRAIVLFVGGLIIGTIIVFVLKQRVKKWPLWQVILFNMAVLVVIIFLLSILGYVVYYWLFVGKEFFEYNLWVSITEFLGSYNFILNIALWTIFATLTIIVLQINDKYGRGVFLNSLLGKYYSPRVEERIFMFIDLKASTTIAEELGHKKYFKLLNNFFEDATIAIIENRGEIYQYVGDEVVVTWPLQAGLRRNHCLQCFFDIEDIIKDKAHKYMARYNLVPAFKAALHCGEVSTGEVGTIKKDLIFTGDVLNTTARIEALCNEFSAKLLISEDLRDQLTFDDNLNVDEIGKLNIRGKSYDVRIFRVNRDFVETNDEKFDKEEKEEKEKAEAANRAKTDG